MEDGVTLSIHDVALARGGRTLISGLNLEARSGDLIALRVENWKATFMEQRAMGLGVWREPFVSMRIPKLYNLRSDPFERGDVDGSMFYDKWMVDRAFLLVPAQAIVSEFLKTFEDLDITCVVFCGIFDRIFFCHNDNSFNLIDLAYFINNVGDVWNF